MSQQNEINIDIVKITSNFVESLPKSSQECKNGPEKDSPNKKRSVKQVNINGMSDPLQKKLNDRIYEPYFISNSTILEYQNCQQKLSILEIVSKYFHQKQQSSKLYFKVMPYTEADLESNKIKKNFTF